MTDKQILDNVDKAMRLGARVGARQMLDKIRSEIDSIELSGRVDGHTTYVFVRTAEQVKNMALDIIDKHISDIGGTE